MSEWNIAHITSSPNYAQSNSLAERSIQLIKKLLKKCKESKTDIYIYIYIYRLFIIEILLKEMYVFLLNC